MLMPMQISKLSKSEEDFSGRISENFESRDFVRDSVVVYKGQIPNVAILLVEGAVVVGEEQVSVEAEDEMFLIGFNELMNRSIISLEVKVLKGSKVVVLDKDMGACQSLKSWRQK